MKNKFGYQVDYLDFWAQDEKGHYYHICEGTGDNLLKEDIEAGYVDYIYYEIFFSLNSLQENDEDDGGQVLLKEYYQDLTIEQIIDMVADMESCKLTVLD